VFWEFEYGGERAGPHEIFGLKGMCGTVCNMRDKQPRTSVSM
jgi:hypothetical protein